MAGGRLGARAACLFQHQIRMSERLLRSQFTCPLPTCTPPGEPPLQSGGRGATPRPPLPLAPLAQNQRSCSWRDQAGGEEWGGGPGNPHPLCKHARCFCESQGKGLTSSTQAQRHRLEARGKIIAQEGYLLGWCVLLMYL